MSESTGPASLTFKVELVSGSVHEHTFDVTGLTGEQIATKFQDGTFFNFAQSGAIELFVFYSPMALYWVNHIARIEFGGSSGLEEIIREIKPMGFLGRER